MDRVVHDVTDVEIIQREDFKWSPINKLVDSDTVSSSTCIRVCHSDKFNLTPGSQREFIWMKSDMSHLLQTTIFNGRWLKDWTMRTEQLSQYENKEATGISMLKASVLVELKNTPL